jgi:hypothetical protein
VAGPGDPSEGEIGWVVVVQPNVPKQTGTNESCDRESSPSRPKWTIVQVVVPEDELGVAVDDAIRVGESSIPHLRGHATVRSSGHA